MRHRLLLLLILVGVSVLLFFGDRWGQKPVVSDQERMRQQGQYASLTAFTGESTIWTMVAGLKRGDISTARRDFLSITHIIVPGRRDNLRKALFLRSKEDITGTLQFLEQRTHEDPAIRSLFLGLRAYLYCEQKKRLECEILAGDSVLLDPLSAFGLQVQGIAYGAQREFELAKSSFQRAEKLNGICDDSLCLYYRGMTQFYRGNYDTALEDLLLVVDDQILSGEVSLRVGRTYASMQNFEKANEWFVKSSALKGGTDRISDMRLARIAIAQDEHEKAEQIYTTIYLSGKYGLELVTDFIKFSFYQNDLKRGEELSDRLDELVGSSPRNFLLVSKLFREIGQGQKALQFLERGRVFIDHTPDVQQRDLYTKDFLQEERHTLVQLLYTYFSSGEVVSLSGAHYFSGTTYLTGIYSSNDLLEKLESFQGNKKQLAFLYGLQSTLILGVDTTSSGFVLLPEIQPSELSYIRLWYVLFQGNTRRALEILTGPEMSTYDKNDPQILWLKRAITTRLDQQELAKRYLNQLKEQGVLDDASLSLSELRKQAFASFGPRIYRMSPYFPVDYRRIGTKNSPELTQTSE